MSELLSYKKDGFLLKKNFFPKERIEALRQEAKRIFTAQLLQHGFLISPDADESTFEKALYQMFQRDERIIVNCGKQIQHLISLHQLSLDNLLVDKVKSLGLAFPVISTRPVLYFNTPHLAKKEVYNKLTAHQDWRSMQGSLDSMVVWIPLVNTNVDLGALEIVPESHKLGLLDSDLIDGYGKLEDDKFKEMNFVPVEVEQGDALFFSTFLVHRSGNNITDSIRWSCHFRYNNLNEATFIKRNYPHPYIYKPQEELITPNFPAQQNVAEVFN